MLVRVRRTLLLLVVALWHQAGNAAVITSPGSTVWPNNDNYAGRGNPNVERLGTLWLGVEDKAGTKFDIEDSGGTTEYAFTVSVTNYSGVDWAGYKFWLALDGQPDDSPVVSRAGDGFGFEVSAVTDDPLPESDGPTMHLQQRGEDVLCWSGRFAGQATVQFSFSLDVPDHLGVQRVWLFEQPTLVPEPSGFALLGAGLGALALCGYMRAPKLSLASLTSRTCLLPSFPRKRNPGVSLDPGLRRDDGLL
jgi:hypothetical protein